MEDIIYWIVVEQKRDRIQESFAAVLGESTELFFRYCEQKMDALLHSLNTVHTIGYRRLVWPQQTEERSFSRES